MNRTEAFKQRMRITGATFVLLLSAVTVAPAQQPPEAHAVVERLAAAISAGDAYAANALISQDAVWSEHDLLWRVASDRQGVWQRLRELTAAHARLELEVEAVLGDGTMVIVAERLWSDEIPDDLAPLRSTTLYVVERGLVQGIIRVLSSEQVDALMAGAMVGSWRCGVITRFDADGAYARFLSLEAMCSDRSYDRGAYAMEAGVVTTVSGEGSEICEAGQFVRHRWNVIDADTFALIVVETDCPYFAQIAHLPILLRRLVEE
jgi:ketosteroid isomerase-like protein